MIAVNLGSVAIASVAAMGVGFAWYSDSLLGKQWKKLSGLSMNGDKSSMSKAFSIIFLTTLITAYVLAIFIHYAGAYGFVMGAKTGLWAWLGFVMPVQLSIVLFNKKPMQLFLIDTGHQLVALMVMGAILGMWF